MVFRYCAEMPCLSGTFDDWDRNFLDSPEFSGMMPIDWDKEYAQSLSLLWETGEVEDVLISALQDAAPGSALDAGCGLGTDLVFMAGRRLTVTGIDISLTGLKRATARISAEHLHVPLVQGDVCALPFKGGAFDFINDRGCFHHVPPDRRKHYVYESSRVLRPDGMVLLRCFGEKYFAAGGTGYPLKKSDIREAFSPYFETGDIIEYQSSVSSIPVDMCWCRMRKKC